MKMVEIKLRSITADYEKTLARKERNEKMLAKAIAKVEKLGCKWTEEEHREFLKTCKANAAGWMTDKKEIEKNSAWYSWLHYESEVERINKDLEYYTKKLDEVQERAEAYHREVAKIEDAKTRQARWQEEFEAEQKDWAKDGITLEARYYGKTPKGLKFYIEQNNGWTDRSLHCYTLTINGETIFTSGEFWRCYLVIKNR